MKFSQKPFMKTGVMLYQLIKRETKMILFVQMSVTQLKKIVVRFTG